MKEMLVQTLVYAGLIVAAFGGYIFGEKRGWWG